MRSFLFGIFTAVVALAVAALVALWLGYFPSNADVAPSNLESSIANRALDASMDRHAPRVTNPLPPTDENIIAGMKIYTMACAECHGDLNRKPSAMAHSFYPPVPQLILHPVDDPEWHIFYVVRTGIRYSGMPAWSKTMSEEDMWKVTAFLARIDKLSPGVQDYWKKSYSDEPTPVPAVPEKSPAAH
jgi:mono/diheme cytochrome c family protein